MIQMTLSPTPRILSVTIEPTELVPVQIDLVVRLATGETIDSASCADGGRGIGNNVAVAGTSVQLDIAGLVNGTISLVVITALGDAGSIIRCVLVVHCIDPAHRISPVVIPPTGALIMRGVYRAPAIYRQYDVVTQAGAPWFALVDVPAAAPGVDANEWAALSGVGSAPELTGDQLAAVQGANLPAGANPFATITDLSTLAEAMAADFDAVGTAAGLVAAEVTARNEAIATAINTLVNAAPGVLDTLAELASALGDDPDFAATVATALAAKANSADLGTAAAANVEAFATAAQGVTAEAALPKVASFYATQVASFSLVAAMVNKHVPVELTADGTMTIFAYNAIADGEQVLVENASSTAKNLTMSGSVVSPKGTKITQGNRVIIQRRGNALYAFGGISA